MEVSMEMRTMWAKGGTDKMIVLKELSHPE